jgi:rubredoxin
VQTRRGRLRESQLTIKTDAAALPPIKEENIMKYECVCGYVYDEAAEGTKWENLPDDYVCPVCGAGKDAFTKQ